MHHGEKQGIAAKVNDHIFRTSLADRYGLQLGLVPDTHVFRMNSRLHEHSFQFFRDNI
jgi:hypothetical protein